jgi:hypothetical protein
MKKALYLTPLLLFFFSAQMMGQDSPIFPKGELSTTKNHTGNVWLKVLDEGDTLSTTLSPLRHSMPVQNWIGTFIPADRSC